MPCLSVVFCLLLFGVCLFLMVSSWAYSLIVVHRGVVLVFWVLIRVVCGCLLSCVWLLLLGVDVVRSWLCLTRVVGVTCSLLLCVRGCVCCFVLCGCSLSFVAVCCYCGSVLVVALRGHVRMCLSLCVVMCWLLLHVACFVC